MSIIDRARGALVGLAVGDSLGTTLEFRKRDTYPLHTEMTGGGPFKLQPGEWTDDTSMALALADSLIAYPEFNAKDLMDRFVSWYQDGTYSCTGSCFDIGNTTRAALEYYIKTGKPYAGSAKKNAAGNGSLMRIAPVAIAALDSPEDVERLARLQSLTTHGEQRTVEACIYFAELLRRMILEGNRGEIYAHEWRGHSDLIDIVTVQGHNKHRNERHKVD